MKFLGLAAVALAMTVSASADTILIGCGSAGAGGVFSFSAGSGNSYNSSSGPFTGSFTCPAFSSLPAGDTFVSEQLVLQTDYTGGTLGSLNTIQTTYTPDSENPGVFVADTLTSTSAPGTGGSETYVSADSNPVYTAGGPAYFLVNTDLTVYPTTPATIDFSSNVTAGTVQGLSGQAYELITYTSAVPEPASMLLMGGGLVAFALVGRKLVRR